MFAANRPQRIKVNGQWYSWCNSCGGYTGFHIHPSDDVDCPPLWHEAETMRENVQSVQALIDRYGISETKT